MMGETSEKAFSKLKCVKSGKLYLLDHTPFKIGRSRDADIICVSSTVSRNHCELKKDPSGRWTVFDKGSFGTFINKKLLKSQTEYILKDNDVISVGELRDNVAWTFVLHKQAFANPKQEEELKNEINRLREALDREHKLCEEKIRKNAEELGGALIAKDLELAELKNEVNSVGTALLPVLKEKEAERDALQAQLTELHSNLERTITEGIREKEIAEQRLREQQEQLQNLNQAKEQIEGNLNEELKRKHEAEDRVKELALVVAQQGMAEPAVPINDVEQILESELQCGICSELFITAITLNCTHTFCSLCLKQWKKKICPICRANIVSENRSLVLDNYIQKMVDSLSLDFRQRRQEIVEERRRAEETPPARGGRNSRGGRGRARNRVDPIARPAAPRPYIPRPPIPARLPAPVRPQRVNQPRLPIGVFQEMIDLGNGAFEIITLDSSNFL